MDDSMREARQALGLQMAADLRALISGQWERLEALLKALARCSRDDVIELLDEVIYKAEQLAVPVPSWAPRIDAPFQGGDWVEFRPKQE